MLLFMFYFKYGNPYLFHSLRRAAAIQIAQALDGIMKRYDGKVESGELVTREQSAGRLLSQAVFAR